MLKLGAAKKEAGRVWSIVGIQFPYPPTKSARSRRVDVSFHLKKDKLHVVRRREGRYLLRSNLTEADPAKLWEFYMHLVEVEAAFKNFKGDLAVRPFHHQLMKRIEAHVFVAFLAYCIYVSLREKLRRHTPGLTVRQLLDKMRVIQMLDAHFPTTDERELIFTRYTQPDKDQQLLLMQMGWTPPAQPPPRITAKRGVEM
ncbi:MAG: hypothetical protein NTZ78_04755 [Candidatus Aureabacteria bacterium]|nr:hypothetical protein [Candidatus Auribacterota bacterium]